MSRFDPRYETHDSRNPGYETNATGTRHRHTPRTTGCSQCAHLGVSVRDAGRTGLAETDSSSQRARRRGPGTGQDTDVGLLARRLRLLELS